MIPAPIANIAAESALLGATSERLWYAAPLIVSISLVYASTRHEETGPIVSHAARFAMWILVFMLVVTGVLQFLGWMH
ncbi:MAG: hypothetical protein AAGF31_08355 [Planctomycetota bacterium]